MKTADWIDPHGLRLLKKYGQNFLSDDRIAMKIVEVGETQSTDRLVEVGAGCGTLTHELLRTGLPVHAFEIDPRFEKVLRSRFGQLPNFHLYITDFLNYKPESYWQEDEWVFFGNLPYNVSVAILRKALFDFRSVRRWVFMFQYEVALRLCASPGSKDYGSLSILVQSLTRPQIAFKVSKSHFKPSPKVDSAVVTLDPIDPEIPEEERDAFSAFVRKGFANRRKMLKNNFPEEDRLPHWLESLSKPLTTRAEELGVTDWINLYKLRKQG